LLSKQTDIIFAFEWVWPTPIISEINFLVIFKKFVIKINTRPFFK
jgi:hypothetical protein